MEFSQRGVHQNQPASSVAGAAPAASTGGNGRGKKGDLPKWLKWTSIVLLLSVGVVLVGLVLSLALSNGDKGEAKYVDTSRYQAVFLNGGQVYFGQIKALNSAYVRINDIYYLRVNQTVQPDQSESQASNDVSLVKLGCELHGPQDEMLVNRDQVVFWENLKDDGQVAKAVAEYKKQNPDGQKCETTTPANPTPAPSNP